jgi:hypothetical protein
VATKMFFQAVRVAAPAVVISHLHQSSATRDSRL